MSYLLWYAEFYPPDHHAPKIGLNLRGLGSRNLKIIPLLAYETALSHASEANMIVFSVRLQKKKMWDTFFDMLNITDLVTTPHKLWAFGGPGSWIMEIFPLLVHKPAPTRASTVLKILFTRHLQKGKRWAVHFDILIFTDPVTSPPEWAYWGPQEPKTEIILTSRM